MLSVAFDPAEFIDGIRQLYKIREGWLAPFPWCEEFRLNLDNIFTKLKIVRRKKEKGTKTDETVAMNEIFKPHEECAQPRTVLIEGKPGMGKTTFCDKLAYDWAAKKQREEETLCPNFKEVLLLKCRDIKSNLWESIEEEFPPRSAKQKKEEFFKSVLWDAVDDQLLPRGITKEDKEEFFKFVRHNQPDILMVLDGLDELPTSMLPAFKEIIQGRMLPKCHILVTARHEVGMKVRECCDSLLEMEGLTQADAQDFIVKFFKPEGAELAQSLLNKLARDQNLRQLTQSPLNTALLCLLCEESEGIFPQNGSQLYLEIVECVLRRYRKKKGLPDICEDLIDVYKTPLKRLGLIALNGLLNSKFYFEKSDFENCGYEWPEFGLLSFERGQSKRRPSLGYSFLHKTFQELFAAFYICCQVLGKEICPKTLIADNRYFNELKQVLLFTCGLLSLQSKEAIDTFVASIAFQVNNGKELLFALECIGECKNEKSCPIDVLLARTIGSHLQIAQLNLSRLLVGDGDCTTLAEAIKHNSTITQLDLSRNLLGFSDCNALVEAIKHNSTVTQLNLSENCLYISDCTELAEAIKHNSTITELDLSSNGLDTGNFAPLAEAIKQNSTITQLNWSENDLSAGDCTVLAEGVKQNSSITKLNLSTNGLGTGDCTLLAAAIKQNSTITQLDLSFNGLGTGDCTALAEAIKHNSTITQLDFSVNELGTGDCSALAEAIKHNSTITHLNLSDNGVDTGNCTALAEAIRYNSTITQLDLSGNDLGVGDCTVLMEAIKHNSTILKLDLSRNKLVTGDCSTLAEAIKHNLTITQLNLSWNELGTGDCTALAEAIKNNSVITQLDLAHNDLGGGDCTALVEAIKHHSTITYLILSGNFVSDSDLSEVAEEFKHSPYIPQLSLLGSERGAGDCTALAEAIKHNSTITQLDLSGNNLGADVCTAIADSVTSKTQVDVSGRSALVVRYVPKDLLRACAVSKLDISQILPDI